IKFQNLGRTLKSLSPNIIHLRATANIAAVAGNRPKIPSPRIVNIIHKILMKAILKIQFEMVYNLCHHYSSASLLLCYIYVGCIEKPTEEFKGTPINNVCPLLIILYFS